jgi:hypothetical protein
MVRREAINAAGGYDVRLGSAEDLDLWFRLLEAGWQASLVPIPLLEYRRRAGSLSASSVSMARWDCEVFAHAVERLEKGSEQAAARQMLVKALDKLQIESGIAAITEGRSREGFRTLRSTSIASQSTKWRIALAAFGLFPPLLRPVLGMYQRRGPFA